MDGVFWSTRLRGPDIASGALSVTLPRPRRAGCPSLHCPLAAELRIVRPLRGWRCRPRPRTRAGRRRVWPRRRRRGGALDLGPPSPAATPPAAAGRGGRRRWGFADAARRADAGRSRRRVSESGHRRRITPELWPSGRGSPPAGGGAPAADDSPGGRPAAPPGGRGTSVPPPAQARAAHPHDAPSTPTHSGPGARTPLSPLAQPVFSPQGGGGNDVRMSGADDNIGPAVSARGCGGAPPAGGGAAPPRALSQRPSLNGPLSLSHLAALFQWPSLCNTLCAPLSAAQCPPSEDLSSTLFQLPSISLRPSLFWLSLSAALSLWPSLRGLSAAISRRIGAVSIASSVPLKGAVQQLRSNELGRRSGCSQLLAVLYSLFTFPHDLCTCTQHNLIFFVTKTFHEYFWPPRKMIQKRFESGQ